MEIPVLIVGGGPTGLAASLLLARQGTRSLLVERHAGTSVHPKATGISTRTMEIVRQLGLEPAVRAEAMSVTFDNRVAPSLAAAETARRPLGYPDDALALALSPTRPAALPQDLFEPILLTAARAAPGAELRFGTELREIAQDAGGVTATLLDRATGHTSRVRARYVIAADGWNSPTRQALGVASAGEQTVGEYLSVLFRAPLAALVGDRPCGLHTVQPAAGPPTILVPSGRDDRWVCAAPWRFAERPLASIDHAEAAAIVRRAVGVAELPVEVLDVRSVGLGTAVADRFRVGRVFLAGDAAHRMMPTGGMGLNTAVHDVHNLAWKLAAVLGGWAGDALLDSYEAERRPVAERHVARSRGQLPDLSGVAADLGAVYASSAVAAEWDAAARVEEPDAPSGVGRRATHVWLEHAGRQVSTVELGDGAMTLLAGPAAAAGWTPAATQGAAALGVPLAAYRFTPAGEQDAATRWRLAFGIAADRAVLLRPDGHVAWQSPAGAAARPATVYGALAALLGRGAAAGRAAA